MSGTIGASSYALGDQLPSLYQQAPVDPFASVAVQPFPFTGGGPAQFPPFIGGGPEGLVSPTGVPAAGGDPAQLPPVVAGGAVQLPAALDGSVGFGHMVTGGGPTVAQWPQQHDALLGMSFFPGGGPIADAFAPLPAQPFAPPASTAPLSTYTLGTPPESIEAHGAPGGALASITSSPTVAAEAAPLSSYTLGATSQGVGTGDAPIQPADTTLVGGRLTPAGQEPPGAAADSAPVPTPAPDAMPLSTYVAGGVGSGQSPANSPLHAGGTPPAVAPVRNDTPVVPPPSTAVPIGATPVVSQQAAQQTAAPGNGGGKETIAPQPGAVPAAAVQPVAVQAAAVQPVAVQAAAAQPVLVQAPAAQPAPAQALAGAQPMFSSTVPAAPPVPLPVNGGMPTSVPANGGQAAKGSGCCCSCACSCGAAEAPAKGRKHKVKRGESLLDIARRYGISAQELRSANSELLGTSRVKTDMVLVIPGRKPTRNPAESTSNRGNQPQAPRTSPSRGQVTDYVRWAARQYGGDPDLMLEIARRESSLNTTASNNWDSNARAGTPSKGLFQFIEPTFNSFAAQARKANPRAWEGLGELNWHDWRQQSLAAAWAVENGKAGHWSTYRSARQSQ